MLQFPEEGRAFFLPMSQPSNSQSLSSVTDVDNSRDSFNAPSVEDSVEVDAGSITILPPTGPKYVLCQVVSTRSHKSSPVWKYFGHFNLNFHYPVLKLSRICLICRESGFDKAISVGKDASPSALVSHLKTHKVQYAEYEAALVQKRKDSICSVGKAQSTMTKFTSSQASLKENFKRKFAKWIVEDSLPLVTCRSQNFKRLIAAANRHVDVPSYQTLMSHLYQVKMGAVSKMKAFLKGKFYSLTMDHWTSLATDNYGAITLHVIDDFQLHAFVLSCVKHENGCTAVEMERQLLADMSSWGLERQYFVSCITDSASNMNSLGGLLDNWNNAPILRHYYCSDHILQLTAVHAYSGNVRLGDGHDVSVGVIKKARNLVSHVNSSIIASDKIKSAQLELSPSSTALKLVSDCETRWWSTHS